MRRFQFGEGLASRVWHLGTAGLESMTLAGEVQPKNVPSLRHRRALLPPEQIHLTSTQQPALLGVWVCLDRVPQDPPSWQSPPHSAGRTRILSRNEFWSFCKPFLSSNPKILVTTASHEPRMTLMLSCARYSASLNRNSSFRSGRL